MERPSPRMAAMLFVSGLLLVLVLGASFLLENIGESVVEQAAQLRTAVGVQQDRWSEQASQAIARSCARVDEYRLQLGTFSQRDGQWQAERTIPVWQPFIECGAPVTLVFATGPVAERGNGDVLPAARTVYLEIDRSLANAPTDELDVTEVELDFGCPIERLSDYAALLSELKSLMGETRLVVQVAPEWLDEPAFREVLNSVDGFVLRVRSDPPEIAPNGSVVLCRTEKIPGYLEAASATGKDFWLLLPTRAVRYVADADGSGDDGHEGQEQVVYPNASAMAAVVRSIESERPDGLKGILWESLPIDREALIWPWSTLEAVMTGNKPLGEPGSR